jgi:3-oxoacyl-[acyl-carrier protein] reductase
MSKTLFITGGNGEIGKSVANNFIENGYEIIKPGSSEMDCSNNDSINSYFKNFKHVPVTAFVHCAGINNPKAFMDSTPATLLKTIQVNTLSFLYITQHLNSHFEDGVSRVVAVSSIYGSISRNKRIEYATSKHGLMGMVKTLALELAQRNILVNSVSPGFIETKLTYKNNSTETINNLISDIPLKKLGKAEYVADLIYFLCSEKNNFITGQDIIIDGGYLSGGFQS